MGANNAFIFGPVGLAELSVINVCTDTLVWLNTDNDAAVESVILMADGAVTAARYTAADFILQACGRVRGASPPHPPPGYSGTENQFRIQYWGARAFGAAVARYDTMGKWHATERALTSCSSGRSVRQRSCTTGQRG